jgi:glycosyltransferase involved in cell wall biosynthesis
VIYPPVDLAGFELCEQKDDFYLCASRLMEYKRVEIIAEAFAAMPHRRLIIIGDGPQMKAVKRACGPNVTLLGYQPDEVLKEYLQKARAFVFAAQEDFGILPVEAQACGTPVIAFGKGGVRDIVRDLDHPNPSGLFFDTQSASAVVAAIERFEHEAGVISAANCRTNAERFSVQRFREAFTRLVEESISERKTLE